jgi:hypothetical protein
MPHWTRIPAGAVVFAVQRGGFVTLRISVVPDSNSMQTPRARNVTGTWCRCSPEVLVGNARDLLVISRFGCDPIPRSPRHDFVSLRTVVPKLSKR